MDVEKKLASHELICLLVSVVCWKLANHHHHHHRQFDEDEVDFLKKNYLSTTHTRPKVIETFVWFSYEFKCESQRTRKKVWQKMKIKSQLINFWKCHYYSLGKDLATMFVCFSGRNSQKKEFPDWKILPIGVSSREKSSPNALGCCLSVLHIENWNKWNRFFIFEERNKNQTKRIESIIGWFGLVWFFSNVSFKHDDDHHHQWSLII